MYKRAEIIQRFVAMFDAPTYLEIGVCRGETFLEVTAARKIAVDVYFDFDFESSRKAQPECEFAQMSSDAFFADPSRDLERYDVVFIDGLHTFEQTLRDLINVVPRMSPLGVIIIDDVLPESYAASLPDITLTHTLNRYLNLPLGMETFFQPLSFRTVEESHGVMVAWRNPRPASELISRTVEAIGRLPFEKVATEATAYRRAKLDAIEVEVRETRLA
jgi:hypothetical protein